MGTVCTILSLSTVTRRCLTYGMSWKQSTNLEGPQLVTRKRPLHAYSHWWNFSLFYPASSCPPNRGVWHQQWITLCWEQSKPGVLPRYSGLWTLSLTGVFLIFFFEVAEKGRGSSTSWLLKASKSDSLSIFKQYLKITFREHLKSREKHLSRRHTCKTQEMIYSKEIQGLKGSVHIEMQQIKNIRIRWLFPSKGLWLYDGVWFLLFSLLHSPSS